MRSALLATLIVAATFSASATASFSTTSFSTATFSTLSAVCGQQPVLSEVLATNGSGLRDEDGDASDWIEIHNSGAKAMDLGGWYLTDDPQKLRKFKLPKVELAAGGYMVVFASGKNRRAGTRLHTNFKLAGAGEFLALVKPDGVQVASQFAPRFPRQRVDVSYGYRPGSPGALGYFPLPTPGKPNRGGLEGIVARPRIAVAAGYHRKSFETRIHCSTPGARIRYTTDGSPPSLTRGHDYKAPIRVEGTTVLRAAAFLEGMVASPSDSRSYLFVEQIVRQPAWPKGYPDTWGLDLDADYGMDPDVVDDKEYREDVRKAFGKLPTLSLVMDHGEFFGPNGMYINSRRVGRQFERPVSAEFLPHDGKAGFQVDCGLRLQGMASRNLMSTPKHSFSLRFRRVYGPARLDYPLFEGSRVRRFQSLNLRAGYNCTWLHRNQSERTHAMMTRDQWARQTMVDMGHQDAGRGRHVHLFFNGLYWGIYLLQERPDAAHFAQWHGGSEADYSARNGNRSVAGRSRDWFDVTSAVRSRDWAAIQKVLDVDCFIDWLLIEWYVANTDWNQSKNWRSAGGGKARARWRFYVWDTEKTFDRPDYWRGRDVTGLLRTLDDIPEFRVRFGDRVHRHCFGGGALTPEQGLRRWRAISDPLDVPIVAESARWGDYRRDVHQFRFGPYELYTRKHFRTEMAWLARNWFPARTSFVVARLRGAGLYPQTAAPVFSQHGGRVAKGYVPKITAKTGTIHYTLDGTDPRLVGGKVRPGARQVGRGSKPVLEQSTVVKARVLDGSSWSVLVEASFEVR